ncbi:MAG TPA: hypothetical protein VL306_01125 [Methylomirabilota bacterium]|nr:hypothetical protein [Methylomirabilota bacterium]
MRLRQVCLVFFLALWAQVLGAQAQEQVTLKAGQQPWDALTEAGCDPGWLWQSLQQSGITEVQLLNLPAGTVIVIPSGCKDKPTARMVLLSAELRREFGVLKPVSRKSTAKPLPQLTASKALDLSSRTIPQVNVLPTPPLTHEQIETSWKDLCLEYWDVILVLVAILIVALAIPYSIWRFRRWKNYAPMRLKMQQFAILVKDRFLYHHQSLPPAKRAIKQKIKYWAHQGRFELWLKRSGYPCGKENLRSVHQDLCWVAEHYPTEPFLMEKVFHRRGWLVIRFLYVKELEVADAKS